MVRYLSLFKLMSDRLEPEQSVLMDKHSPLRKQTAAHSLFSRQILTLTLDSVHMTGNTASTAGGGVSFDSSTYRIINSTISGNNALDCGGFVTESSTLTVVNSTFSGNRATTGDGGGFCNNRSTTTLRNVTITNNTSNLGGGAALAPV
jgi:hypothetical protein